MIISSIFKRPGREDIFVLGEQRLERLRAEGRYSCFRSTRAVLHKLSLFQKGKPLPLNEVSPELMEQFQQFLAMKMGNSRNTIVENIKVVQRLLEEGGIHRNLCSALNLGRIQTPRTYLLESELEQMMALRIKEGSEEFMARDIFFIECRTGLRISDLLLLKWQSCQDGVFRLMMQKTHRSIEVPMTEGVKNILSRYRTLFSKDNDYVFPLLAGSENEKDDFLLSKKVVYATARVNVLIKRLAARAGLGKPLSTHVGRHTFATMLLSKGASIYEIKELLGHSDVKVTQVYAHILEERKRELVLRLE